MNWSLIIEKKIRDAQAEGKFDNLQGQGRPLNLDENPFEDPAWRLANHLLKENGFRPDWLEDDVALREKLAQTRAALTRSRDWRASALEVISARDDAEAKQQRVWIAEVWDRAQARFCESLAQINAGIANLNLKAPHIRFQRLKLVVEDELRKIVEA